MPFNKIVRKGDTFVFLASVDGRDYVQISHVKVPMAKEIKVGLWGTFDPHGRSNHTTISNVPP